MLSILFACTIYSNLCRKFNFLAHIFVASNMLLNQPFTPYYIVLVSIYIYIALRTELSRSLSWSSAPPCWSAPQTLWRTTIIPAMFTPLHTLYTHLFGANYLSSAHSHFCCSCTNVCAFSLIRDQSHVYAFGTKGIVKQQKLGELHTFLAVCL